MQTVEAGGPGARAGLKAGDYGIDKEIGLSDHWPLWAKVKLDKQSAPSLTALVSGEVEMSFANIPSITSFVKAGRLRTLFSGEDDLPARLGGEEFGVVLDGQDLATAAQRAEHFRANLVEHPVALHGSTLDGNPLDGVVLAMTASIGIAEFDSGIHRDVDELYSAADRAVYRAKAAGRNRVYADEPALAVAEASP